MQRCYCNSVFADRLHKAREQLLLQGYVTLPEFVTDAELGQLQEECDALVAIAWAPAGTSGPEWAALHRGCVFEVLSQGTPSIPGSHMVEVTTTWRGYAVRRCQPPLRLAVAGLLLGERTAATVSALLGSSHAYLFNDQYIVKPARSELSSFAWHRDSDWCPPGVQHELYISVWVALDDASADNGGLLVAPGSHLEHSSQPDAERGVQLDVRAGTAVVMTDKLLHCSGPNTSSRRRRAWMPQFSQRPVLYDSGLPVSLAVPLKHTRQSACDSIS